jgi:malonate transporter and related proteins
MVRTILSALAPIVFTLLLGFVAAWRHDFGPKEAAVLPLALFVGTVGTPRADLVQDITLVFALFAAIVGLMPWCFCCSAWYFASR